MTKRRLVEAADRVAEGRAQSWRRGRALSTTTALVSTVGDAALVALSARWARHDRRIRVGALVWTFAAERVVMAVWKRGTRRQRPGGWFRPPVSLSPRTSGFPSGHTSLGFFAASTVEDPRRRRALRAAAAVVALGRFHQGVHHPSDLVVGAVLGSAGGQVARWLARTPSR